MTTKKGQSKMFWTLTIIGSLTGLFLILIAIGFMLPADYSFTIERRINAPIERVWSAIHSPKETPIGGKQCCGVEIVSTDPLSWIENLGASNVTYSVTKSTQLNHIVIHGKDNVVPMYFDADITLDSTPDTTTVTAKVKGRIDRGTFHVPIFRIIIHLGGPKSGFGDYLNRIAIAAEK